MTPQPRKEPCKQRLDECHSVRSHLSVLGDGEECRAAGATHRLRRHPVFTRWNGDDGFVQGGPRTSLTAWGPFGPVMASMMVGLFNCLGSRPRLVITLLGKPLRQSVMLTNLSLRAGPRHQADGQDDRSVGCQ